MPSCCTMRICRLIERMDRGAGAPLAALVLVAALFVAGPPVARGDEFPTHAVRLIVPQPPGGPADLLARLYAARLTEQWHQSVVVENRPGATGTMGTDVAARASPDGYTLLMTVDLPIVMAPNLIKTPYDPRTGLLAIAAFAETMQIIAVHPGTHVKTLEDLRKAASARPGTLTFASAGTGSPGHLCGEMLNQKLHIRMVHVPYKGAAPAATALESGEVSLFCGPITQTLPAVRAGRLNALVVTGPHPSPLAPDVPMLVSTYPDFVVTNWYGVFAPPATPSATVQRILAGVKAAHDDTVLQAKLRVSGIDPLWLQDIELRRRIDADLRKWKAVIDQAGIKAD